MKTQTIFKFILRFFALLLFLTVGTGGASAQVQTLDSLPIGSAIQITGQGGAEYTFIKLAPFNDDGSLMAHSDGTSGTYWMLADNYCNLANTPTACVNNAGVVNANLQAWNNTNDNNWIDMVNNGSNGVWQRVLMPMFNDLPTYIGGLPRNTAILEKPFPMMPMNPSPTPPIPSGCNLTSDPNANLTSCTWTGRIALPSFADWQTNSSGVVAAPNQVAGVNANAFANARFGSAWAGTNPFNNWSPWLRSPFATTSFVAWMVTPSGSLTANDLSSFTTGVSPVIWLSSSLSVDSGSGIGTYASPFQIFDPCTLPENANRLDCLPIGAVIRMTGQGGANYRFIKLAPFNDDGSAIPHSDGTSGSYWMLADNYCALANIPSSCTNAAGVANANAQAWSNTSNNDWVNMVNSSNGVFQRVLQPLFNDLPTTIGGLPRDTAIPQKAFPMSPMDNNGQFVASTPSGCNLTDDPNVDLTNCTWTGRISLPSYADWQTDASNSVGGWGQLTGTNADAFARARTANLGGCSPAGCSWPSSPDPRAAGLNWHPWFRSPVAPSTTSIWIVNGLNSTASVGGSSGAPVSIGVSPVLWLSSSLSASCGAGTYTDPFQMDSSYCNTIPSISLSSPTPDFNYSIPTVSIVGTVTDPDDSQTLNIRFTLNDTTGAGTATGGAELASINTPADSVAFSGNLAGLNTGTYTLRIWACDGVDCSNYTAVTFSITLAPAPLCGSTWTPAAPVPWKSTAEPQEFILTGSVDVNGNGMTAEYYSCIAPAINGATCTVTIMDNNGVTNICTSPANRINLNNTPPTLTLDTMDSNQALGLGETLFFPLIISDPDDGQTISVTATVYSPDPAESGMPVFTKTVVVPTTSPVTDFAFGFPLSYDDLVNLTSAEFGWTISQISFVAFDDVSGSNIATFSGTIVLGSPVANFNDLTNMLNVRFAGQLYYPASQRMTTIGETNAAGYTLQAIIDANHQVWTRELLIHPSTATTSSTTTADYPFLIRFFETTSQMGEVRLR